MMTMTCWWDDDEKGMKLKVGRSEEDECTSVLMSGRVMRITFWAAGRGVNGDGKSVSLTADNYKIFTFICVLQAKNTRHRKRRIWVDDTQIWKWFTPIYLTTNWLLNGRLMPAIARLERQNAWNWKNNIYLILSRLLLSPAEWILEKVCFCLLSVCLFVCILFPLQG